MKKMRRLAAALLALAMFLGAGAALAEVPERGSVLNVREISAKEDALAYAKEIWQLDFLGADISGIAVRDPKKCPKLSEYTNLLYELRKAKGLTEEAVARITDIICSETEYAAAQLSIIEVRA